MDGVPVFSGGQVPVLRGALRGRLHRARRGGRG